MSEKDGHLNWSSFFNKSFDEIGYTFREYTDDLDSFLKIRVLITELDSIAYQHLEKHGLNERNETDSKPILKLTDLFSDIDVETLRFYLYAVTNDNTEKGYSNLGIRNKHIHPAGLLDESDDTLDVDFGLIVYVLLTLLYKIHDGTTKD